MTESTGESHPRSAWSGDPRDWFGGRNRVMFVHAHPDDETITTGGTLAGLAEAGREPLIVTLTRGEQGEVVAGPLRALVQSHGIALVRQNELRTALGMLAVERHVFLGVPPARAEGLDPVLYEDSGMQWDERGRATAADTAGPDALTSVPAMEALNDLLTAADAAGAEALVSYDDTGGYGHPDHVLAHRLTRAVAVALGLPFYAIQPDGTELNSSGDAAPQSEHHAIEPWFERKVAALRAYATQLTVDGDTIVHVGGQRQPIARVESFALVHPSGMPLASADTGAGSQQR